MRNAELQLFCKLRACSKIVQTSIKAEKTKLLTLVLLRVQERISQQAFGVFARENKAEPKDQGRPFTFIFSHYKSYPKGLTNMTFGEISSHDFGRSSSLKWLKLRTTFGHA